MVLALTLTLVLTLVLAQITKVPLLKYLCSLLILFFPVNVGCDTSRAQQWVSK